MSASSFRDPGPVPPRWLSCPRKSHELVAGKFLAFKTPLDNRFDSKVEHRFRFAPDMIFASMKSYRVKIGLWIDLCNTSRFYDKALIEGEDCKYVKLHCKGHGETPSEEQVGTFVRIVSKFIRQHPLEVIAVHCTHGFNRTGFLVSAYLIQIEDWSPEAALAAFAKARPPGIYKEDYIQVCKCQISYLIWNAKQFLLSRTYSEDLAMKVKLQQLLPFPTGASRKMAQTRLIRVWEKESLARPATPTVKSPVLESGSESSSGGTLSSCLAFLVFMW